MNVNINLQHINRGARFCSFCINISITSMEDEEHILFECSEYNSCRLKYHELFISTENNVKDLLDKMIQTSISNFLWDIRNIRMISGKEC